MFDAVRLLRAVLAEHRDVLAEPVGASADEPHVRRDALEPSTSFAREGSPARQDGSPRALTAATAVGALGLPEV